MNKVELLYKWFLVRGFTYKHIREFVKFLMSEGIYEKYIANVIVYEMEPKPDWFLNNINEDSREAELAMKPGWDLNVKLYSEIINYTLYWSYTLEGHFFWAGVHHAWVQHVKKLRL